MITSAQDGEYSSHRFIPDLLESFSNQTVLYCHHYKVQGPFNFLMFYYIQMRKELKWLLVYLMMLH
jgi:hypothetical protein